MNAHDAARRYLRSGFAPIPVPARAKAPTLHGWQQLALTESDVESHFQPNGNVGLLLGAPSHGLMDVDLDAPEAIELAESLLPFTEMIHGRASKPDSHYWYRVSDATSTKQFRDIDGSMLVELRGTGGQTIVPPSVHPSGEVVEWSSFGTPTELPHADLFPQVGRLAAATLLARHYPQQGGRQDFAMALAGTLLRAERSPEDTSAFIGAIAKCARDEEWVKRADTVARTLSHLTSRSPVTGFRHLSALVGQPVAERVAEWLAIRRSTSSSAEGPARSNAAHEGTQLARLLVLTERCELFHNKDDTAFITVHSPQGSETIPVNSQAFTAWISRLAYDLENATPREQTLKEVMQHLTAKARYFCPEKDVRLRVAGDDKAIYIDLANETRQIIEVTADGWRIVQTCDHLFHRPSGMRPLPIPKPLNELTYFDEFFNCASLDDRRLLLAWLAFALTPNGPYPLLLLQGEAGSAKSTLARMLRLLVDPAALPLRSFPRDERDFVIAARSNHVLSFDNLSGLTDRDSDTVCKVATGAGFATRQLYSDYEEVRLEVRRPVILNGIDDLATRQDAIDRAIVLSLPSISSQERRPEETILRNFEKCRPFLLGALLDLLVSGLRRLPTVSLTETPRMADFARKAVSMEEGLGWPPGGFMRAYRANQEAALRAGIEASPVACTILKLLEVESDLYLTPTALLDRLAYAADDHLKRSRVWPRSAAALGNQIRRVAPALRTCGIQVEFERDSDMNRTRRIRIQRYERQLPLPEVAVQTVRPVQAARVDAVQRNCRPDSQPLQPPESTPQQGAQAPSDDLDASDGKSETVPTVRDGPGLLRGLLKRFRPRRRNPRSSP